MAATERESHFSMALILPPVGPPAAVQGDLQLVGNQGARVPYPYENTRREPWSSIAGTDVRGPGSRNPHALLQMAPRPPTRIQQARGHLGGCRAFSDSTR